MVLAGDRHRTLSLPPYGSRRDREGLDIVNNGSKNSSIYLKLSNTGIITG